LFPSSGRCQEKHSQEKDGLLASAIGKVRQEDEVELYKLFVRISDLALPCCFREDIAIYETAKKTWIFNP
jgi:hypothetical protein